MAKGYYRREFLDRGRNDGQSGIEAQCLNNYPTLTIVTCEHNVTLDFETYQEEGMCNAEQKIDILYEVVRDFRTHLKRRIRAKRRENSAPDEGD